MDFYSLKRKKLQALCKKHGIPANKTNLEMAKLLALTLQETGELISEDDGIAVNEKKKVRFSPHEEIREYEPSGYSMKGRTSRRRTTLAKYDIMANDNLSNKVLGKKRGRLNEKVGRTTRSLAELDKERSSCMIESEPLEEGDEVQASLQTGEDIVKDSMPAAGLRRSRRKSVVTVVGKVQQLKEEVEENVANLNNKVQRRSSRRSSAATTNKMNETAARIGQQKRKCEAEAIQGIETSMVVDKSLVGQPTRRSTRLTSKRVNNRQKGTSKMAIVVEETTFTNASTQSEDAGLSKNDTCTTSTQNEDGGLSMQDAKSLEKKGKSCSGKRSVVSIDVCTLQSDAGKEMDSPGNSEDIAVLAPINLESASTGEALKIAGQSLLFFSGEAEEHDAEKPSEQPPKENLRLEDVIELPENVTNDEPIGKKVDEYQYGECEHPKESPCLSMSYGANFDLAKESQMQAKETTLLQNIQDSIGHQLEENKPADYEENAHIITRSKGVKVELMGDDGPKTFETRMDQLSRISQEDREDEIIEDEEIIMGENDTAQISCEDLIDPSNYTRIGESAIDHQEVAKEQLEMHQDTGEGYLMDDNACLISNKLLLSVDDSKKANNLEDLNAVPSKNEGMVDRKSASASSGSPYNENETSECKVEKPSEQALQVDLVSKDVAELIGNAFCTERFAVEVVEHQHGECENQMENLHFAISNEVIFEHAKELEQNESPKVAGDAVQDTALFEQTWNSDPRNSKEGISANLIVENGAAVESINNVPKICEIGQGDCKSRKSSSTLRNLTEMVGSKPSNCSKWECSRSAEVLHYTNHTKFHSCSSLPQQNSQAAYEDHEDETMEDEEIIMGENDTAQVACEDLIDPSNGSRIGESAIDHEEVAKEQLEVHQDTGEDYLMDDNACLTPNKLLLSVDDSKKANNLEDLEAVPSKNEAMVDRKSASASSGSPYNENGTSECKVEKPSKHALQVDLVSKAVTELIRSAFGTERIAVEVAEHQHGECESQMENLNFAISNEVIFEQAKELEQNESPKVIENAFGTVRIAQEVLEHQHSECENQMENLHFAVSKEVIFEQAKELEQNESPKVVGNAVQDTALFEQTWNCGPSNSKEDRSANLIVANEEAVESINNVPETGEIGQENEALELNMFFGEDEEIEVEKPSEQPLEFNLTSRYASESIEKVKITEPDGEQAAEYQYGQCEHQTEGQFLTISDDAEFGQAKEPQVQANRPIVFDDIQDSIAHEIQENKSVETEANVNIAVENEGEEMKLMDVVPKKCEMTLDQFSEFGQEEVKDQVMEDVEIIIGENGGAQTAGEDTNDPADNSSPENSVRDHQEVSKEQSNMQQGIGENLAYAEQKDLCTATLDKLDREAVAAGDIASSVVTNDTLHNMVGSKQSSSSNWEVSKPAEILLFADAYFGKPEFASVSFLKLENSETSNEFEVQEREESAFRENDRTLIACKDLEDTANGLSIGSTTRNHQDAAKEKEASEQNLFLGEGEEYEIEKSSEHPSQVSLTREGDERVLQENVLIAEPASKQEDQVEGPCITVSDEAKFQEVKEQQSVLLCCGADQGDGTNCKGTLRKLIGSDEGITTFKVFDSSAIKENAMSIKKSKVGDLTAPKTLMKRRPLEDVTEKA